MVDRLFGSGRLLNTFFDNTTKVFSELGTSKFRNEMANRAASGVLQTVLAELIERFRGARI